MVIKQLPFPISDGLILDPYAGSRKWWKGLEGKNVTFVDKFVSGMELMAQGNGALYPNGAHRPNIQGSVSALPFGDAQFDQIIADPPHFIRKSKFAPSSVLGHFGQYHTRADVHEEWREASKEFHRVTKAGSTMILKTIDGAKTVSQCVNNQDLDICFTELWDKKMELRIRSLVPWSSAWTVFTYWKRR